MLATSDTGVARYGPNSTETSAGNRHADRSAQSPLVIKGNAEIREGWTGRGAHIKELCLAESQRVHLHHKDDENGLYIFELNVFTSGLLWK